MPTLVDTSVWVEHFRTDAPGLRRLLDDDLVLAHRLVIGELACGNLRDREEVLDSLQLLPEAPLLDYDEILTFIERHRLGWIDVHLLASARLFGVTLWTLDRPLQRAAKRLHCGFEPPRD
jgi:predicted nucleic acid-binding protein